jgi:hypothetical protein
MQIADCRIDLRGNMISDPAEISRLTSSPNMKDIYVAGNPFTKTHTASYRLSIFNYFRLTPGFIEDVSVDGSGPGVMERRHLNDRVFEKPPPPANLQRLQSPPPLHTRRDVEPSSAAPGAETQTIGRNALRKKSNRQRIVSLDGSRLNHDTPDKEDVGVGEADVVSVHTESSGDEYVRRLMTMREEAGPGWLNVLSQSGGLTGNGGIQEHH